MSASQLNTTIKWIAIPRRRIRFTRWYSGTYVFKKSPFTPKHFQRHHSFDDHALAFKRRSTVVVDTRRLCPSGTSRCTITSLETMCKKVDYWKKIVPFSLLTNVRRRIVAGLFRDMIYFLVHNLVGGEIDSRSLLSIHTLQNSCTCLSRNIAPFFNHQ